MKHNVKDSQSARNLCKLSTWLELAHQTVQGVPWKNILHYTQAKHIYIMKNIQILYTILNNYSL